MAGAFLLHRHNSPWVSGLGFRCSVQHTVTASCRQQQKARSGWLQHQVAAAPSIQQSGGGRRRASSETPLAARIPVEGQSVCGSATREPAWGGTRSTRNQVPPKGESQPRGPSQTWTAMDVAMTSECKMNSAIARLRHKARRVPNVPPLVKFSMFVATLFMVQSVLQSL